MTAIHCWGQEIQLSLSAVASSGSLQRARQSLVLAAALIHFFFFHSSFYGYRHLFGFTHASWKHVWRLLVCDGAFPPGVYTRAL